MRALLLLAVFMGRAPEVAAVGYQFLYGYIFAIINCQEILHADMANSKNAKLFYVLPKNSIRLAAPA
jgi:hypothetical protein